MDSHLHGAEVVQVDDVGHVEDVAVVQSPRDGARVGVLEEDAEGDGDPAGAGLLRVRVGHLARQQLDLLHHARHQVLHHLFGLQKYLN